MRSKVFLPHQPENENVDEVIQAIEDPEQPFPEELQRTGGFYLEPIIFLISFSGSLIDTILTDVIRAQYCSVVLGRPQTDCQLIHKSNVTVPVPQEDTETFTTTFLIVRYLIEAGLPSLAAFYTGPWSDKFGRKPVILSTVFGNVIRCAMYMVMINYPTINPWYYLVCSIPYGIFGGTACLFLGTYCYISDISTDNRTTRFLIVQCIFVSGTVAGIQCALYLNNFLVVFAVATALTFTAYSFAKQVLPESIHQPTIINLDGVNPLSSKHIRDLKDVCYAQQTPKNRLRILLIVLIIFIALVAEWGDDGIMYLFLKEKLDIELPSFTIFVTYVSCIGVIEAVSVNHIFTTKLEVATVNLLGFAVFVKLLSVFCTLVGYRLWHFYFVRTFSGFAFLITAPARSYLATLVPEEHIGKVFGLLVPIECFALVLASSLYVEIFNWTAGGLPEAVFVLSSSLMLSDLILVFLLLKLFRNEEHDALPDQISPATASTYTIDNSSPMVK